MLTFAFTLQDETTIAGAGQQEGMGKGCINLVVQKCAKLIRINDVRVEEGTPIEMRNGCVITITLPLDPSSDGTANDATTNSDKDRLTIQFTFVGEKPETETEAETESQSQSQSQSPLKQGIENSPEDSPALTMPQHFDFNGSVGQSNSFESNLFTMQSASNLSQNNADTAPLESNNKGSTSRSASVLLSSLSKDELDILKEDCGEDEKGKFKRLLLELALENDAIPRLLQSTLINAQVQVPGENDDDDDP